MPDIGIIVIDIYIALTLWVGALSWTMGRMARDARRAPRLGTDGVVTLRYGPVVGATGFACMALALLIAVLGAVLPRQPGDLGPWLGLINGFGVAGLAITLVAWRYRLIVGPAGLQQEALGRARRELPWGEVRVVRFSRRSGYVTLEGSTARVRASVMLRGVSALWEAIEANLPHAVWVDARVQFDTYLRGL